MFLKTCIVIRKKNFIFAPSTVEPRIKNQEPRIWLIDFWLNVKMRVLILGSWLLILTCKK